LFAPKESLWFGCIEPTNHVVKTYAIFIQIDEKSFKICRVVSCRAVSCRVWISSAKGFQNGPMDQK